MSLVFVTGGTGCVGRPVVRELLERGHAVSALTRTPTDLGGARPIFGSLEKLDEVMHEASKADSIIHLACARSNARATAMGVDIAGTGRLIDGWQRGSFVYASSQTVYGVPRGDIAEDAPLDPVTWYDLAKLCNEFQLKMAAGSGGRGAGVSLRMALQFGPGRSAIAPQFLDIVYEQCLNGATFLFESEEGMDSYGSSFIGDRDLARAIVDSLAIRASGPYNLAGGYCTWRALIEAIDKASGTRSRFAVRVGAVPQAGEFRLPQSRSYMDDRRFRAETGFVPRQGLDEAVARFVRARQGPRHG